MRKDGEEEGQEESRKARLTKISRLGLNSLIFCLILKARKSKWLCLAQLVESRIHDLLVIGVDVASLAASARRAGYKVYAVDHFGDQDLRRVCEETLSITEQREGRSCGRLSFDFNPNALLQLARSLQKRRSIDAALLSSGLEDFPNVLFKLSDLVPILGNPPELIQRVRDREEFFHQLKRLGIQHPETAVAEDFEEAKRKSKEIGYPVVVKPIRSFAGSGIRKVKNLREFERAFKEVSLLNETVLVQEYISGMAASASLISSGQKVSTLTVNEQLIGIRAIGQQEPFGYCGNVVPLSATKTVIDECKSIAEKIVLHFGLIGSNGVDLVISEEGTPNVIEVNPRFQGTLECVERVLGINVIEAHVKACTQGTLTEIPDETSGFCTRLIVFAPQRSIVPDLNEFQGVRDMPLPGVIVEKGEPVCSMTAEGASGDSSFKKANKIAKSIAKSLCPT